MPFQKGNQLGRGRPKISLNKPEMLLPVIFLKAHINWANDFCKLYKTYRNGVMSKDEKKQFDLYLQLMPYLVSKVQIKDLDAAKYSTPEDSKAMAMQTKTLLDALEKETSGPNSKSSAVGPKNSMGIGQPPLPPTTKPATDL